MTVTGSGRLAPLNYCRDMTVSQNWRRTLLAGVTVPALGLAACGIGDDGNGGDGGDDGETATAAAEADSWNQLSGLDLEGAPSGFEPTEPGAELDFDDVAYVVTQPGPDGDGDGDGEDSGPLQFWRVTVAAPENVPADDIPLTDGAGDVDTFVCLPYTVEFLGVGDNGDYGGNGEAEAPVAVPELTPVDDHGTEANRVELAAPEHCDVDEDDILPGELDELTGADPGDAEYKGAVLTYVDKDPLRGINATGMSFTYSTDVPELDSGEPVLWN